MRPTRRSIDDALVPHVVRFLEPADLHSSLRLSWVWFRAAAAQLYRSLAFSQLAGNRLARALLTLQKSVIGSVASASSPVTPSAAASASTLIEYHTFVRSITISHIVFEQPSATPLQSWYLVRDLLGLCASTLRSISIAIGDDSFVDLPPDYSYLHARITFPQLSHLNVTSKCMRLPEKLILELLRASPIDGLASIRLPRCLPNFGAPGWFLIAERGGQSLLELVLTPAIGSNMLGWDEQLFSEGLQQISRVCSEIRSLDISGHSHGIADRTLFELMAHSRQLRELHLPCGLTDAHLVALLTNEPWHHLETLGLTCHCVDGSLRERQPNGMSCNRFADTVIIAVLDHLVKTVMTPTFSLQLPVFVIAVKTGKRADTMSWLSALPAVKPVDSLRVMYKDRIVVSAPTSRIQAIV
eukprot:jgi/Hompol1/1789/HPOL_004803-RA